MPTVADATELSRRFLDFAQHASPRAPLYARLSIEAADDPEVLALLQRAPEQQQIPVLLFAAVHHLLLGGIGEELAAHYPNLGGTTQTSDPAAAFRRFVRNHRDALAAIIATRSTQTNEVGRCATFLPAFGLLHREQGALAHVDVGTSAGLNLLLPRYHYRYEPASGPASEVGDDAGVSLQCATHGAVPIPAGMPHIARSIGLDAAPIDVLDDDEVRWLEACVWPDQADRFARLVSAIELARLHPPDVRTGDAVNGLAPLVREASRDGHPVVTNSWVLNYLSPLQRSAYLDTLEELGAESDLSWVIAESPALTPELPVPTTDPAEDITVITMVRWRSGDRTVDRLATAHPHGYWLRWEAGPL